MFEKNGTPFSSQAQLFLEDIYDALKAAVMYLGGPKVVAARLWPNKPIDQARRELLDCLNRDNDRKFDLEEVLALLRMAREAGFHQAKHWIDREVGYQETPPADPVVERDRLAEAMERMARQYEEMAQIGRQLLERDRATVRAVR